MSPRSWTLFMAVALITGASIAACGSSGGSSFDGGPGSGPDATVKPDGPGIHFGDGGGEGGLTGTLKISPGTSTLTITDLTSPPSEVLKATLTNAGKSVSVTPIWSLADYTVASIDSTGRVTPKGNVGGDVTVQASYSGLSATGIVHVLVNAQTSLGDTTLPDGTTISQGASGISPGNKKALGDGSDSGALHNEPGAKTGWTTLIYPYDQTVFPRGLLAPVAQFSAGSITPEDFKISLDATDFHWDGFGHIGNPAALQVALLQAAWDGALLSAVPDPKTLQANVTLTLVVAAKGLAFGPFQSTFIIAPGSLTGVIYYESYGGDTVMGDAGNGGTDFGLWAVKPGGTAPPSNLQSGCVICHGVSASGNTITTGTDDPTIGYATGVYRIEGDGGYTHLATSPPNLPYPIAGGVDSRGLGWGVVSPDGKIVLRSVNQFWGGQDLLGWAVPDAPLLEADGGVAPLTTTMTVDNGFNFFAPSWAVDQSHLVYINATNTADAGSAGAPSQSVGIVDVTTSLVDGGVPEGGSYGTVALKKPRTIYDSTSPGASPANAYTKVPAFLPDSETVVLEETLIDYSAYDHMLPDYQGGSSYVDGTLYTLQPKGSAYVHTELANANASYDPNGVNHNFEPHPLPVSVGGYYWVVFASLRTDAYPQLTGPKKLWVAAITPGTAPGKDPSHPPFTLVNQSIVAAQPCQRAFWALAPCLAEGASCTTGSDCCDGSCLPSSPTDPSSPLVCRPPSMMTCAGIGGRCSAGVDSDCCNSSSGVKCIGTLNGYGTCGMPAPP